MTRVREVLWLVVVIAVVALGFYFVRPAQQTAPAGPSPSASQAGTPQPAISPPRSKAPLERTQFTWEATPPYGSAQPWFRFEVRGTPGGATFTARMSRGGRSVEEKGSLTREQYRAFITSLEDRGAWLLRDDPHTSHGDTVHYQAYIQSGDWTRRASFCEMGDPHAKAFVEAVQLHSFIAATREQLAARLANP